MARFFVVLLTGLLSLSPAAMAQTGRDPGAREPAVREPALRGDAPAKRGEKAPPPAATTLESLYDRLAKAKTRQEGGILAKQIERRWARSGSETADLLLTRANQLANKRDAEQALEIFDYIIQLKPDWAEAYHRRATVLFLMDDIDGAMRDIRAALSRDPRHFSALAGLGMLFQRMGNDKAAFTAFNKALELHPTIENLRGIVDRLAPEVEGRKA